MANVLTTAHIQNAYRIASQVVPNGSATAKALDYSLKRWVALTRYL